MATLRDLKKIHKRVLVVDDDEPIRDVLCQYMQAIGLDAVCAASGEEGLKAFTKGHFDIVISDIKMAQMDGLTLLNEIKQIDPDVLLLSLPAIPPLKPFWKQ